MVGSNHTKNTHPSVLIVDDEPMALLLMRFSLTRNGYRVIEATGGEDALSRLHDVTPDALVLDVMMPGMNGYDLCRQARKNDKLSNTPIIMLSGAHNEENEMRSLEAGATCFLSKPISGKDLADQIETLLN